MFSTKSQKKDLTALNGWILLDKPNNISSAHAINMLKKIARFSKIGHAGTLDPFATGLLVVAIGKATRIIDYAMDAYKEYEFTITWGESTDTIDPEGEVIEQSDQRPNIEKLEQLLSQNIGAIMQVPPKFSAIKINGRRAYDMARAGEEFEINARKVDLFNAKLLENSDNAAKIYIKCGKGFYVRSLAAFLIQELGVCGHVTELRRLGIGKFSVNDAISLADLQNLLHNVEHGCDNKFLHPLDSVLDDILVQNISEKEAESIRHGRAIACDDISLQDGVVTALKYGNSLIAIAEYISGFLHPKKVF